MRFKDNLIEAMDWAGVSCGELAEAVRVSASTVYHWRSGHYVPHPEVIGDIADRLDCTCDWLIRGML